MSLDLHDQFAHTTTVVGATQLVCGDCERSNVGQFVRESRCDIPLCAGVGLRDTYSASQTVPALPCDVVAALWSASMSIWSLAVLYGELNDATESRVHAMARWSRHGPMAARLCPRSGQRVLRSNALLVRCRKGDVFLSLWLVAARHAFADCIRVGDRQLGRMAVRCAPTSQEVSTLPFVVDVRRVHRLCTQPSGHDRDIVLIKVRAPLCELGPHFDPKPLPASLWPARDAAPPMPGAPCVVVGTPAAPTAAALLDALWCEACRPRATAQALGTIPCDDLAPPEPRCGNASCASEAYDVVSRRLRRALCEYELRVATVGCFRACENLRGERVRATSALSAVPRAGVYGTAATAQRGAHDAVQVAGMSGSAVFEVNMETHTLRLVGIASGRDSARGLSTFEPLSSEMLECIE